MQQGPTADEIIARAQQQIATRRQAEAEQRWTGAWRWLPQALMLAVLAAFVAAPGALPQKLLWFMGGVCGLRPTHSSFAGGLQLPIETRMLGIFGGFSVTLLALLALPRWGARQLGSMLTIVLLALFFLSMVFDGVNSTAFEFNGPYLYAPTNTGRLITGLLSGIALAPFVLWLLNFIAMPKDMVAPRRVIQSPWELALPFGLNALFAGLVVSGSALVYYPVALLSVGGVVLVTSSAVLLVVISVSGLDGRVTRARQLATPGVIALLVAVIFLAGTAAARWSTVGSI